MHLKIIEELTNLGAVRNDRFTFVGLPLRVKHLDSSPIRAIAIEE
jgi:kynurenine formamidase